MPKKINDGWLLGLCLVGAALASFSDAARAETTVSLQNFNDRMTDENKVQMGFQTDDTNAESGRAVFAGYCSAKGVGIVTGNGTRLILEDDVQISIRFDKSPAEFETWRWDSKSFYAYHGVDGRRDERCYRRLGGGSAALEKCRKDKPWNTLNFIKKLLSVQTLGIAFDRKSGFFELAEHVPVIEEFIGLCEEFRSSS